MTATVRIHAFPRVDPQLLARLQAAKSPDIANVLGRAAVADPALRPAWRGARVLGSALTVSLSPDDNLGAIVAVMEGKPGDVLVVQGAGEHQTAIVGALAARAAAHRGLAGMVIDGAARDILDLEAMRFPVWSRHVCARQSTKDKPAEIGGTVTCGGVRVAAGDVVLADDDGVVFAPPNAVAGALEGIAKVLANEERCRDPEALLEVLGSIVARASCERS